MRATVDAKNLKQRPSNIDLLKLYALYKQAIFGDCNTGKTISALVSDTGVVYLTTIPPLPEKPPFTDIQGRAKWEAWNQLKGTSRAEGQQKYIDLVDNLRVK